MKYLVLEDEFWKAIITKAKEIVTHFCRSPIATQTLICNQLLLSGTDHAKKLLQEVPTR